MKLLRKKPWIDTDYICAITDTLDEFKKTGINKESGYYHYIFIFEDIEPTNYTYLPIRLPGRTVGTIVIKNGVIQDVHLEPKLETLWYKEGIMAALRRYIGKIINFKEEINNEGL